MTKFSSKKLAWGLISSLVITNSLQAEKKAGHFQLKEELKDSKASTLSTDDKKLVEQIMDSFIKEGFDNANPEKIVENVADDANFVNQAGRSFWGKESNYQRHKVVFSALVVTY